MNRTKFVPALLTPVLLTPVLLIAQSGGLSPTELLKPLKESWPTYNGDYSGCRYSSLKQVNAETVKNLSLAWMSRLTAGAGNTGGGLFRGRGGGAPACSRNRRRRGDRTSSPTKRAQTTHQSVLPLQVV